MPDMEKGQRRDFWIGLAFGVLVAAFVIALVLVYRMDTASCLAWGHKGEIASCRVRK